MSDNEELEDAPESAHVKRTAQEDFEPEAFVVRRSMPWADATSEGLEFVAFGATSGLLRSSAHPDVRLGRRNRGRTFPFLTPGHRGLLLVSAGRGWEAEPERPGDLTAPLLDVPPTPRGRVRLKQRRTFPPSGPG